jgi:hypothetical protein
MPKKEFCKRNHLMSETRCYDKSGQPFCRLCKNITAIERRKKNLATFRKRDSIFNIKKHYGLNETASSKIMTSWHTDIGILSQLCLSDPACNGFASD